MALIVQNDAGSVVGANAYVTNATFRAYMDARARTYTDDDDKINAAIIAGSDYLDTRYQYKGRKQGARDQRQQWPRIACYDNDRMAVQGIPQEVKDATCEYAARAMVGTLNPDPVQDSTGMQVAKTKQQVGPIDVETEYFDAGGNAPKMPVYFAADMILKRAGLTITGGMIVRG